ncbi:hypothetical protein NPIL_684441 [Nephila pilipes]|uniref:Uncharacterized protein n=1 Tax=Nephila pilipes TaxID=299642 RepID=A0A8X6T9W5_NEPPI|nr:hypothetical protein NPIL_391721 [Nephila pilipes]GFT99412.1 hypothetical protein NPIL_684441 [Nephila pilipes]
MYFAENCEWNHSFITHFSCLKYNCESDDCLPLFLLNVFPFFSIRRPYASENVHPYSNCSELVSFDQHSAWEMMRVEGSNEAAKASS